MTSVRSVGSDQPGIPGFSASRLGTTYGDLYAETAGSGPTVVLLHGFPQTSLMWREVAPALAERYRVVALDLPGYGRSDVPRGLSMSKRDMATVIHDAMLSTDTPAYSLVGHDRGGRVAYRAALDRPESIETVAVLDVVPLSEVWARADDRFALGYWPFSLLAQPAPFPETLVAAAPAAIVDNALGTWGSAPEVFSDEVRTAYVDALRDRAHVHAICEEYRAAAGTDRETDERDAAEGRRIRCPLLCLWSSGGALDDWYADAGGPLGIWQGWADTVAGRSVAGGHFFPEQDPENTARELLSFLKRYLTMYR